MATSGSAGKSKQSDEGSLSQNEQRTMDHILHQIPLLNGSVTPFVRHTGPQKQGEPYHYSEIFQRHST